MTGGIRSFLSGVDPNVDLGNLLVGIATLVLALTTVLLATRTSRQESRTRIASFRQQWVDELREKFVSYGKNVYKFTHIEMRFHSDPQRFEHSQPIVDDMIELQLSVLLMLNPREIIHRQLYEKMTELHGKVLSVRDLQKSDRSGRNVIYLEARVLRREMVNLQKKVLKLEWDRVRSEISGHSKIRRNICQFLRARNAAQQDSWWSADRIHLD